MLLRSSESFIVQSVAYILENLHIYMNHNNSCYDETQEFQALINTLNLFLSKISYDTVYWVDKKVTLQEHAFSDETSPNLVDENPIKSIQKAYEYGTDEQKTSILAILPSIAKLINYLSMDNLLHLTSFFASIPERHIFCLESIRNLIQMFHKVITSMNNYNEEISYFITLILVKEVIYGCLTRRRSLMDDQIILLKKMAESSMLIVLVKFLKYLISTKKWNYCHFENVCNLVTTAIQKIYNCDAIIGAGAMSLLIQLLNPNILEMFKNPTTITSNICKIFEKILNNDKYKQKIVKNGAILKMVEIFVYPKFYDKEILVVLLKMAKMVDMFIPFVIIQKLVTYLEISENKLNEKLLKILQYSSISDTLSANYIIRSKKISTVINFLDSSKTDISEDAAFILINIIKNNKKHLQAINDFEGLSNLAKLLYRPDISSYTIKKIIKFFLRIATVDIQLIIDAKIIPYLIECLYFDNDEYPSEIKNSVKIIFLITQGSAEQRNALIDAGAIPALSSMMKSENHENKCFAKYALQNMAAGSLEEKELVKKYYPEIDAILKKPIEKYKRNSTLIKMKRKFRDW